MGGTQTWEATVLTECLLWKLSDLIAESHAKWWIPPSISGPPCCRDGASDGLAHSETPGQLSSTALVGGL